MCIGGRTCFWRGEPSGRPGAAPHSSDLIVPAKLETAEIDPARGTALLVSLFVLVVLLVLWIAAERGAVLIVLVLLGREDRGELGGVRHVLRLLLGGLDRKSVV